MLVLALLGFLLLLAALRRASSPSESDHGLELALAALDLLAGAGARGGLAPSSDEDEDEEELLLLELLLDDERPIVTRRRGAAFTRLFRGAARLLIHGARLRSPLLPRRLSAAQASAAQTGAIVLSEAAARSGVSAAAATRSELSQILLLAIDVAVRSRDLREMLVPRA